MEINHNYFSIAEQNLSLFKLNFPGNWIAGEDRERASNILQILRNIRSLFEEVVISYSFFDPLTKENAKERINSPKLYSRDILNQICSKSIVYCLNNISGFLKLLSDYNIDSDTKDYIKEYCSKYNYLKHIRDSAIHIENRGMGLDKNEKKLKTYIIVLGSFIESKYSFSGGDGQLYEIDICRKTIENIHTILDKIIKSMDWITP